MYRNIPLQNVHLLVSCPTGVLYPQLIYQLVATVNSTGVAQTGVVIKFSYLINEIPITDPLLNTVTVKLGPRKQYCISYPNKSYI